MIVLGRLAANKGQRFLVEAAPAILARFPMAHFVFAGNPEGRDDIEARIRALNLEAHFSLLGFRSDVVNLLHSSDLFVLPSLGEGFSLSHHRGAGGRVAGRRHAGGRRGRDH